MATKIKGLTELQKKLAAMPKATKEEIRKVLDTSADEMVSLAKALVSPNVHSGDLQMSIRKGPGRHKLAVEVMAGGPMTTRHVENGKAGYSYEYDYAFANEHGTIDMPEQPFFWVSYRSVKRRANRRATRAIRKAAKRAIAGG
jgi:HK97 gp10 family phage protein